MSIGCSEGMEPDKETWDITQEPSGTIKMYLGQYSSVLRETIAAFEEKYPQVKVQVETLAHIGEVADKLSTELMAGGGPDVIVTYPLIIPSFKKSLIDSEVFADLEIPMSQDKDFNMSDYYEVVMNSGVYNGKRYFVPLGFRVPTYWTVDSLVKESGVEYDLSDIDLEQFADMVSEYHKRNPDKYFMNGQNKAYSYTFTSGVMFDSMKQFVDFDKRKTSFDSPEFIELLNILKKVRENSVPNNIEGANTEFDLYKKELL